MAILGQDHQLDIAAERLQRRGQPHGMAQMDVLVRRAMDQDGDGITSSRASTSGTKRV